MAKAFIFKYYNYDSSLLFGLQNAFDFCMMTLWSCHAIF